MICIHILYKLLTVVMAVPIPEAINIVRLLSLSTKNGVTTEAASSTAPTIIVLTAGSISEPVAANIPWVLNSTTLIPVNC